MRTLNLRELGVDELPKEYSRIIFFDSRTDYGMSEQHSIKLGEVVYLYGDLGDYRTLEDALSDGHQVTIKDDVFDDDGNVVKIGIEIKETSEELLEKTLWMYEHEYYLVIGTISFPFQQEAYYELALKEGWCQRISREEDTVIRPNGSGKGEISITFINDMVLYNDQSIKVVWVKHSNGLKLHEYALAE